MAHSERHEELVAASALGLPLGDERAELERHLAEGCAVCDGLLADLRGAATALAATVPLGALGPARVAPRETSGGWPWKALAAAAVLALVVLGVDDARLRRQREELRSQTAALEGKLRTTETALAERVLRARVLENDDVQMLLLGGQGPQPDARARVFWSPRARRGIILASNLAPLPPDRQYELWIFLKGKPVNAGVFDADPSGRALFESTEFPQPDASAEAFAVTVEPRGGVPAPTGPIVLVGKTS